MAAIEHAGHPTAPQRAPTTLPPTVFWRIREPIPAALGWALRAASILAPLALWVCASALGWAPPLFLPAPDRVLAAIGRLWAEGLLQQDIAASALRVLAGFGLSALVSVPLGILIGAFPSIQALTDPLIGVVRYMPPSAFIPLLILWLGLGELPKIALIFIGVLFFNTLMVADAVKFVPHDWINTAYTLGAGRLRVLLTVICPAAVPAIIDALRVNLAAAWNLVIIAELVAATSGLGFRILKAQRFLRTDEIFAGLLVIGLIGVLLDISIRLFGRWACPWVGGNHADS